METESYRFGPISLLLWIWRFFLTNPFTTGAISSFYIMSGIVHINHESMWAHYLYTPGFNEELLVYNWLTLMMDFGLGVLFLMIAIKGITNCIVRPKPVRY